MADGEPVVTLGAVAKQLNVRPLTVRRWWAKPNAIWPRPVLYGGRNCWLRADLAVPLAERAKMPPRNLQRLAEGRPAKGSRFPKDELGELRVVASQALSVAGAAQVARVLEPLARDGRLDAIPANGRRTAITALRRLIAMFTNN